MQFPLGGIKANEQLAIADPFSWLRPVTGSEKGTLLEFGLLPVLTSGFIWQFISGLKLLNVNFNLKTDRQQFQTIQKVTSVFLSVVYAVALLFTDYFQQSVDKELSFAAKVTILFQLVTANLIVTLIVEMLDKGYGFSSGVLTLVAVSAASNFAYNTIGIQTFVSTRGYESVGSVINFVRNIRSKSLGDAILSSFTRSNLSNLSQLYIAIASVIAVLYFNNYRVELPIKNAKVRSMASVYPIKLFYSGAMPVLFTYTVLYNLNIFAFAFYKAFGSQFELFKFIASYQVDIEAKSVLYSLNGGLLYFISPSNISSAPVLFKLVRPFTFALFIVVTSIIFARVWTEISGSSAKDVAKSFKEQDILLMGHRDVAVAKELNKIIPTAATTGALILGAIVAAGEFLGSYGTSAAALVSVMGALTILESVMGEWQQSGGKNSSFSQVFNPNL